MYDNNFTTWKYQECIDSSLTGQPFLGKKQGKGKYLYAPSCFSVVSNPQCPPSPNQFNPYFLPFEFAVKFNPITVHVVPFYLQPRQSIFIPVFLHII